jgi:hypothetical protein
MVISMAFATQVFAASVGPSNAGTGADNSGVGTVTWLNPGNITTAGSPYATTSIPLPIGTQTHYLYGTNYGFSIPAGATIDGISVTISRTGQLVAGTAGVNDNVVSLVKGGSVTGSNYASTTLVWPSSLGTRTYGGSSDLWGTTWSPAEINATDFGVALSAKLSPTSLSAKIATVDYMQITVYYTLPTTVTLTYSAGANGSLTGSTTQVVAIGADGTAVSAVPNTGYKFKDWSDASTDNPRTDLAVSGDVTVTANFVKKSSSGGDKSAPYNTSIEINNGAATTISSVVTLKLMATDATFMLISNTPIYNSNDWIPFASSKTWTLDSGLGEKQVWAQFRDDAFNIAPAIYDSIELVSASQEVVETNNTEEEQAPATTVTTQQSLTSAGCPVLSVGDMIKVSGKPAIYALNQNLEVLYFPTGDEFKSWRPTYGGYISISQACFDAIGVPDSYPAAINYHPGSYIVKRPSSDQLYVVEPNNSLAKITPTAATALYGANYKVMTVDDVYWPHYVNRGADIASATAHPGMLAKVEGTTYYVDASNILREITSAGITANGFQERFVRELPFTAISALPVGSKIESRIDTLTGPFALNLNL